uniref:Uncharacterized protein n=1 Tax=Cacopsylla melanoneura TaxID=428564 RepID=A0A8D9EII7_9HEMI
MNPLLVAICNHIVRKLSVFCLLCKVFVRHPSFVPVDNGSQYTGEVPLYSFEVVHLGSLGIVHMETDDFPVCFAVIIETHDCQDFHLNDVTCFESFPANVEYIERVSVSFLTGESVVLIRVLPRLG